VSERLCQTQEVGGAEIPDAAPDLDLAASAAVDQHRESLPDEALRARIRARVRHGALWSAGTAATQLELDQGRPL
jgi:hypothetical protein